MPAKFARQIREWLPGAEQVTIDECGHVPQVERPEETNRLLMEFFARVESAVQAPPVADADDAAAAAA